MSKLHSALNNKDEAIEYLKIAIEQGCDYEELIVHQDFDNIRASKEFTFLVRDTTLVAPELPPGAWNLEIPDDCKKPVVFAVPVVGQLVKLN